MLTSEKVRILISLTPTSLSQVLKHSGYTGCFFKNTEFLGITNGNEFCYKVVYFDDAGTGEETGKVFVKYDNVNDSITADF